MALSLSTSNGHSAHYIKNAIKNYIPISSSISRSNILQEEKEKEKERMIIDVQSDYDNNKIDETSNNSYTSNDSKNNGYNTIDKVTLSNGDAQLNNRLLTIKDTERHSDDDQQSTQLCNGHINNFTKEIVGISPNVNRKSIDDLNTASTPSDQFNCCAINTDDISPMKGRDELFETKLIDRDGNNNTNGINNNNNHYEVGEHIETEIIEIPSVIIHGTSDSYDPTKTTVCYHNNHNTNVYNDTTIPVATTPMRSSSDSQDDEENGEKKRSKLKLRKKLSPAELAKRRQRKKSNKNCKIFFYTAIASSCFLFLYLIYHSLFT